jgi:hypothetical protein
MSRPRGRRLQMHVQITKVLHSVLIIVTLTPAFILLPVAASGTEVSGGRSAAPVVGASGPRGPADISGALDRIRHQVVASASEVWGSPEGAPGK